MTASGHQMGQTGADQPAAAVRLDAVIVGGGIAGLWLANLLTSRGYAVAVLEADVLGGQQTLASQGMIHGGLKYALAGNLTRASEAIAAMPERWRACLAGQGELDLSGLEPLSDRYYLFAEASTLGRLTAFFASRSLRGRISRLAREDFPPALDDPGFRGVVYALRDFVVDTSALLRTLHEAVADRVYRHPLQPEHIESATAGGVRLRVNDTVVDADRLVITAGAGAQPLLDRLGISDVRLQRRPLHQVVVRRDFRQPLFAHCLTGIRRAEPRLTITSHPEGNGWLWYLGGQIATDGVAMTPEALCHHARAELTACLPWIDWRDAEISTLRVDRAEPAQTGGNRPDAAFAAARGACIVAWPTKLSLVPDLGDRVLALLGPPRPGPAGAPPPLPLPPARVGWAPWAR